MLPVVEALFPRITVFTIVRHFLQTHHQSWVLEPVVFCSDSKTDTPPSGHRPAVSQLEREAWPSSHHVRQAQLGWSWPTSLSRPPVLAAQGALLTQGPLTSLHGHHVDSIGALYQHPSSSSNYFPLVTYSCHF